ncbi:MAG: hypothetical protein M3312_11040 [Actinomycetota bacterium]|nr:hypothetical protein [Actinomycetota bacterium]
MIAYKFLSAGAIGIYSGFRWPAPANDEPGAWVRVDGPLVPSANGVHAVPAPALVEWIDDELWLVELGGELVRHEGILIAREGRLVRCVDEWAPATARAFARDCLLRVRDLSIEALRATGCASDADSFARLDAADALEEHAAALSPRVEGFAAVALAYLADAVALARGGRPGHYRRHPAAGTAPSPGAIAANLGFVAAHVAGSSVADASCASGNYDAGFERERERQRGWLSERLPLGERGLGDLAGTT